MGEAEGDEVDINETIKCQDCPMHIVSPSLMNLASSGYLTSYHSIRFREGQM